MTPDEDWLQETALTADAITGQRHDGRKMDEWHIAEAYRLRDKGSYRFHEAAHESDPHVAEALRIFGKTLHDLMSEHMYAVWLLQMERSPKRWKSHEADGPL